MSKIVNKINLTKEEVVYLESILRQATSEARVYVRAKILLLKHKGYTSQSIVNKLDISLSSVKLCLKKFSDGDVDEAINDRKDRGRKREISDSDITWLMFLSSTSRFPCSLMRRGTSGRLKGYRSIRCPMMKTRHPDGRNNVCGQTASSRHGKNASFQRYYEYVRYGTLSLLAGIDLLTGEANPHISGTHKSSDFVYFLKKLDQKYPESDKIRLILDNHSAHTSKETQKYFNTVPDRFEFVFTPI